MKPVIFLAFANDKVDYTRYLRNLGKEQETIEDLFKNAQKQGFCEVKTVYNATFKKIADVFQDESYRDRIAVFHFGGHGDQDILQLETSEGGKALVEAGGFSNFLASQQNLKVVFLNACNTQNFAQKIHQKGISAIGTTQEVFDDELLLDLIYRFYFAISEKIALERAFLETQDLINSQKYTSKNKANFWKAFFTEEGKNWILENKERVLNQFLVKKLLHKLAFLPDVQNFLREETAHWDKNLLSVQKAKNLLIKVFGSLVGQVLAQLFIKGITPQDYQKNAIICYKIILQLLCFSSISYLHDQKEHQIFDFKALFNAQKSLSLAQWKNIFQSILKIVKEKQHENPLLNPFQVNEFEIDLFLEKEGVFEQNALKIEALSQKNEPDAFQTEEILSHLLECFTFLTRYQIISVREVEFHRFKNISQNYIKTMQVLKMGENSQNTILKYDAKPIDSLSVFLQNKDTLINLSPFILDFNTFENNDVSLIGFYEYRNESKISYFLLEKADVRKLIFEDKIKQLKNGLIRKEDEVSIKLETMMHNFAFLLNSFLGSDFSFQAKIAEEMDDFGNL